MKRIIVKLLICILVFSGFSYALVLHKEDDCVHEHHHETIVGRLSAYDFGTCPECGNQLKGTFWEEPTCTNGGIAMVYCDGAACPGYREQIKIREPIRISLSRFVVNACHKIFRNGIRSIRQIYIPTYQEKV